MRRILVLALILFIKSVIVSAQYFEGGIILGITGSQMDGDRLGGYNKPGVAAGMFVQRAASDKWKYRAELKYVMKGAAKITTKDDLETYRKTLHYAELPVMAIMKIKNKGFIEMGLAFGYCGYATLNYGAGPEDVTSTVKPLELSALGGVGYQMNEKLSFNLRLNYSLTPVSHISGNQTIWGVYGQFNNVLTLAVNYAIK